MSCCSILGMRRGGGSEKSFWKIGGRAGEGGGIPGGFSYVWQIKDFKSFVFVCVASKGLTGAFFVCVAGKGLSGFNRLFTRKSTTDYIDCQDQIQRRAAFQNGKTVGQRRRRERADSETGETPLAVLRQQRTGYYGIVNRNIRAYSLCCCYHFYRTVYCRSFSPVIRPGEK